MSADWAIDFYRFNKERESRGIKWVNRGEARISYLDFRAAGMDHAMAVTATRSKHASMHK